MTRDGRTTTAIQPTTTGLTKVDSARAIVVVRSKIRNNSANTPKRGLNLYRLNSAKNTTTIRPVTRILLKPSDGIVPSGFSSIRSHDASRQLASSITRWKGHSGSAGLQPFYFGNVHCPAVSFAFYPFN